MFEVGNRVCLMHFDRKDFEEIGLGDIDHQLTLRGQHGTIMQVHDTDSRPQCRVKWDDDAYNIGSTGSQFFWWYRAEWLDLVDRRVEDPREYLAVVTAQ